jgi:signal transduction histidine kinase
MPLSYFYVIHRRRLGGLETRVNRFVSLYGFLILLCTAVLAVVVPISSLDLAPETWIFFGTALVILAAVGGAAGFPSFQSFVEKRLFGIKLPYQNLQETYSNRITTSTSMPGLSKILDEEVFPTLLVRQYAFMQAANGGVTILLAKDVDAAELLRKCRADELTAQAGRFFPGAPPCGWVRLILPLKIGDRIIGFWLLGRRDPDDYYPQAEIPILQSLANQTAVALSYIEHAEQARRMYQSDIERNEQERMRLALELHDSVLHELAVLRSSVGEASLPPQFQTSYEEAVDRLREIVSDLRPPMLMYGLVPALDELADNLMERSGDRVTVKVDIREEGGRLSQNMESHLFRIAQEACQNSLRHARAGNIVISGGIAPDKLDLSIADDGTGFEPQIELGGLIASRHFGLAGMVERARLIGAEISIKSASGRGTSIHIIWKNGAPKN